MIAEVLGRNAPGIEWQRSGFLEGDVNCDGTMDAVAHGSTSKEVAVAVVLGPFSSQSRVSMMKFPIEGGSQEALCGEEAELALESLDYDPLELLGERLEGFGPSSECVGVVLSSGECDAHHLYWNSKLAALSWWRM